MFVPNCCLYNNYLLKGKPCYQPQRLNMINSESQCFARSLRTPLLAEVVLPRPMSCKSSDTIKTEQSMNLTADLDKSIRRESNLSMNVYGASIIKKGKYNSSIKGEPSQSPGQPAGHHYQFPLKTESPFTKAAESTGKVTVSKEASDRKLPTSFIPGLAEKLRELERKKKTFNSLEGILTEEAEPPELEFVRRSLMGSNLNPKMLNLLSSKQNIRTS